MSQQNYRAPAREKSFGDYPAFKLLAARDGGDKQPSLMMYVHANANNPSNSEVRFVVFTQSQDPDPKKGKIEAKINLVDAVTVMKAIEKVANSKEEKVENIVAQTYRPKDFKNRSLGMIEDVKIVVGKNANGVFISLVSWNVEVPRKLFYFGFSDMFTFITNEEKGQTFQQFSELRALAHAELLKLTMYDEMKRVWRPWVPNNNNNNGGGGYQGSGQGNQGGGGSGNWNQNNGGASQSFKQNNANNYNDAQAELDDIFA